MQSQNDRRNVRVSFGLRKDDLDPKAVSEKLGMVPSHAFAKGDSYSSMGTTRLRPWGVWQLRSDDAVLGDDPEFHARYLLSQIEPVSNAIEFY